MRQLIERADDPRPARPDDGEWAELRSLAEELRRELPNAAVTDDVISALETEGKPSEERVDELLSESRTVLERAREIKARLDALEDGSVVLLED